MYNRNDGVKSIIEVEKGYEWLCSGAKFNIFTGKITHNSVHPEEEFNGWVWLISCYYPVYDYKNNYIGYIGETGVLNKVSPECCEK